MRIIPNSFAAFAFVTLAMIVTSCAKNVETETNVDPEGKAIGFSPLVGHTTRATETTISNLGDFAVVARGMHHDGVLYDTYLIGSSTKGDIAKRQGSVNGDKGTWVLDHNVYWPSTMNQVLFFAYSAVKNDESYTNILGDNAVKFGFSSVGDAPYISGYKPSKATGVGTNKIKADGMNQRDLLVAFAQHKRAASETNVPLNFEHTLTQVSIEAIQKNKSEDDHRIVKIKGAWIVNAAESGTLSSKQETEGSAENIEYSYSKSWSATGKTAYGSVWDDIVSLNSGSSQDVLRNYSLMLIPEDLKGWNLKDGDQSNNGAYIMLLCRVELEHEGNTHPGDTDTEIGVIGDNHYHQLFPVNLTQYDSAEYGFVCVPLESSWGTDGIGKHYTYTLNICGNGAGAGKYPPTMTDEEINALVPSELGITVVKNKYSDTGKNPGDNVLDEPILFTVSVGAWQSGSTVEKEF